MKFFETCFMLWLLLASVLFVGGKIQRKSSCGNHQFRKNRVDEYEYRSIVQSGISGTTNNKTELETTATVKVQNWKGCKFVLEVEIKKIIERNSDNLPYDLQPIKFKKLIFFMKNGMVTNITPWTKSLNVDELNFQRAILSLLQVRRMNSHVLSSTDDDVSGKCKTTYKRHTNGHGLVGDDKEHIDKIKQLSTCKHHQTTHSNIDGQPLGDKISPLLKSNSICSYTLNRKHRIGMQKVKCHEQFLVRAFSSGDKAAAYVNISVSMVRRQSKKLRGKPRNPYKHSYDTNIRYARNHQHLYQRAPLYKERVRSLVKRLAENHYMESKSNTAELFYDLVESLRYLSEQHIASILYGIDSNKENFRSFMFDALAQCGTIGCVGVFQRVLMKQNHLPPHAMSSLAFIKEPSERILRLLMDIYDRFHDPTTMLTLSTLVYKMCNHIEGGCKKNGIYSETYNDIGRFLRRTLGRNCQTEDLLKQKQVFHALKALGNIGQMFELESIVLDCIRKAPVNISVAAVETYRRNKLSNNARDLLVKILNKENEDLEKRAAAFLMLMKNPKEQYIKLAIDLSNKEDKSSQLRSFIHSYIVSAAKSGNKRRLFGRVLKNHELKRYEPPATRFSKAFMRNLDLYWFSGTTQESVLFHPESFVPRSINFNLTTHLFGYAINALEINTRMEGMEGIVKKILGKDGYFSKSHLSKVFSMPDMRSKRSRRSLYEELSILNRINMKNAVPYGLASIKIFGNEIDLYTLDEIPLLNGKFQEANIFKTLYEFTKGKQKTLKRNIILLEASHIVPTLLGLPLNINVNSSAVVTLHINGKLKIPNPLNGVKDAIIEGSVHPSVSVYGSAKMVVKFPQTTEIGTKFQTTMHTSKKFEGSASYEAGKKLAVKIKADSKIADSLNVSYDIIYVTKNQNIQQHGVERKAKGRFCSDQLFNSTSLFGFKTCMGVNFPNAYYKSTVPHFPLTGPFHLGIRDYPSDPTVTHYKFLLMKNDDNYTATFSTPGASNERKLKMTVFFPEDNERKEGGIYFGKENHGTLLSYKFNNETNEFETNIASNYTNSRFKIQSSFFNKTDQATLDRFVGGNIYFLLGKYHFNQTVYYENKYQYWAFGSTTEYLPGKSFTIYSKINYDTQHFLLNVSNPSTKSILFFETVPILPVLKARLNISHMGQTLVYGNGILDLPTYEGHAVGSIKPLKHNFKALARWLAEKKFFSLNGKLNKIPFILNSSLSFENNKNVIETNFTSKNHSFTSITRWNDESFEVTTDTGKQKSSFNLGYAKIEDKLEVSLDAVINEEQTYALFSMENRSNSNTFCINGETFNDESPFGYCVTFHHAANKRGVVIELKSEEDDFEMFDIERTVYPLKMLQERDSDRVIYNIESMGIWSININHQVSEQHINLTANWMQKHISVRLDGKEKHFFRLFASNKDEVLGQDSAFELVYDKSEMEKETKFNLSYKEHGESRFSLDGLMKDASAQAIITSKGNGTNLKVLVTDQKQLYKNLNSMDINVTILLDKEMLRIRSLKYHLQEASMKLELHDKSLFENDEYVLCGNHIEHSQDICDEMSRFTFDGNRIEFLLNSDNKIIKKWKEIVQNQADELLSNMSNTFGHVLKNTSKLKDVKMVQNLNKQVLKVVKHHLLNLKCNGEDVYGNYIEGKLDNSLLNGWLEILNTLPELEKPKYEQLNRLRIVITKSKDLLKGKSIKEGMLFLFKEMLPRGIGLQKLMEKLFAKEKLNLLQEEYVLYIEEVTSLLTTEYLSEKNDSWKNIKKFTKNFPVDIKMMVENILAKIVRNIKQWKYNPQNSITSNVMRLMQKLQSGGLKDLFTLDYQSLIIKRLVTRLGLPLALEKALIDFSAKLNYYTFASRLSRFYLTEYKVLKNYSKNINFLMDSKSMKQYVERLINIVLNQGKINEKRKEKLKSFLNTGDISLVIQDFIDFVLIGKYNMKKENAERVKEMLKTYSFQSTKIYKGFGALIVSDTIPALLKMTFSDMTINDLEKTVTTFLRHINQENNILIAVYKSIKENGKFTEKALKNAFEFIETKFAKSIPSDSYEKFSSLLQSILVTDSTNRYNILRRIIKSNLQQLSNRLKEHLPTNNTKITVEKILQTTLKVFNEIPAATWEKNPTNGVMKLIKHLIKNVSKAISTYSDKYLLTDAKQMMHIYAPIVKLGEENLLQIYTRVEKDLNERLMFLVRLLDQFSIGSANTFSKRFVENGKIKYYELYKSLWKGKVASTSNKEELIALYHGLEARAFDEIKKYSGNFSVLKFIDTMLSYVKTLNYTDINSAIDTYQKILTHNFENITNEALSKYISMLLVDIGDIYEDGVSINEKLKTFLPAFESIMEKTMSMSKMIARNQSHMHNLTKIYIKKGFKVIEKYLRKSSEKKDGAISFLLNIFVPGIDGLIEQIEMKQRKGEEGGAVYSNVAHNGTEYAAVSRARRSVKKLIKTEYSVDNKVVSKEEFDKSSLSKLRCTEDEYSDGSFISSCTQGRFAYVNETLRNDLCFRVFASRGMNQFERDMDRMYSKYLNQEKNSSMCDILNFVRFIKSSEKDEEFIFKLLNYIEGIIIKRINEDYNVQKKVFKVIGDLAAHLKRVSVENEKTTLESFLKNVTSEIYTALRTFETFQLVEKALQASLKIDAIDIPSMLAKLTIKQLKEILSKLSPKILDMTFMKHFKYVTTETRKHLQNISISLLETMDKIKEPLTKHTVLTDPLEFLKSIPKNFAEQFSAAFEKYEKNVSQNVKRLVKEIDSFEKNISKYFEKMNNSSGSKNFILKTFKDEKLTKFLKSLKDTVDSFNEDVQKLFIERPGIPMSQVFYELTQSSIKLKVKANKLKASFVSDVINNITSILKNHEIINDSARNSSVSSSDASIKKGDISKNTLTKIFSSLQDNVTVILEKHLRPQVKIFFHMIDKVVCNVKQNISRYYKVDSAKHKISFENQFLKNAFSDYKKGEKFYGWLIKNMIRNATKNFEEYLQTSNYKSVNRIFEEVVDKYMEENFKQLYKYFQMQNHKSFIIYDSLKNYTSKRLDHVIEKYSAKYPQILQLIALKLHKHLSFEPPTGMEVPIIKYLGIAYKQSKEIFKPISRTAYIFENSIVTFDGKTVYLPKRLPHQKNCESLLAYDTLSRNFTMRLKHNVFRIFLRDSRIDVQIKTKVSNERVSVFSMVPGSKKFPTLQMEFPVELESTTAIRLDDAVKIENSNGITIYCKLSSFACNITISGYYHNKSLGLFGTNNVESSDDLRMPNGRIASKFEFVDFLNSYQLDASRKCRISYNGDTFGGGDVLKSRQSRERKCLETVNLNHLRNPNSDAEYRTRSFQSVCMNENDACAVHEQHSSSQWNENKILTTANPSCEKCDRKETMLRYMEVFQPPRKPTVHIYLLVKLVRALQMEEYLSQLLSGMEKRLPKYNFRYILIGFSGKGVKHEPHVATGERKMVMDLGNLRSAIRYLNFNGEETIYERLGLSAIKYAANLKVSMGPKIFILFENDISFTNSLREMRAAYDSLTDHAITLNVVNSYSLGKRGIGRDSFGYLYRAKAPITRKVGKARFPKPDDFIPLVKRTKGAVFSHSAFYNKRRAWKRSTPIVLAKAIGRQIQYDLGKCKSCICGRCRNINCRYRV